MKLRLLCAALLSTLLMDPAASNVELRSRSNELAPSAVHGVEKWTIEPGGALEQSWSYAQEPSRAASDAPLVVEVEVSGLSYRGEDKDGLVFDRGDQTIRYGRATWVDANGVRTEIAERFADGRIALEVPAAVLDRSAYPAVLDPTITAGVDVETFDSPSLAGATSGAGVAVGSDFVVAWCDSYGGYLARVDPATGLTNPSDLPTTAVPTVQCGSGVNTALAYDGASTLALIWTRSFGTTTPIYVSLLDAATRLPKSAADVAGRVAVASVAGTLSGLAVQWDGANFVVSWGVYNSTGPSSVFAARLDPTTGAALTSDATGLVVESTSYAKYEYACNTQGCLYAWLASNGTHYAYLDPTTGSIVGDTILDSAGGYPVVAWDGAHYLVVVPFSTFSGGVSVPGTEARFVGATASIAAGPTFRIPASALDTTYPSSLAYDGTRFVGFAGGTFVTIPANVQTGGVPSVYPNALPENSNVPYSLSAANGVSLLAYEGSQALVGGIFDDVAGAVRSGDTDGVHTGAVLSVARNGQSNPVATSGNGHTWISWRDSRAASLIYQSTVVPSPYVIAALDPATHQAARDAQIPVTAAAISGYSAVSMTTDGASAIVAVPSTTGITFSRFDANSTIVGAPVTSPSPGTTSLTASLAYGAGHLLLTASDTSHVLVRTYDATTFAPTSDWTTLFTDPTSSIQRPVVTFDGASFFVAWLHHGLGLRTDLEGQRVAPTGGLVDASPVAFVSRLGASALSIDSADGVHLLSWLDSQDAVNSVSVVGLRIDGQSRALGAPFVIATPTGYAESPAVVNAHDGASFLVAWSTQGPGQVAGIHGALVGTDGTVRQPGGAPLTDPSIYTVPFGLVETSPGNLLVAYERELTIGEALRIDALTINTGLQSGACTNAAQCASLACFDGFCCDRACDGVCETCSVTPGKCTPVRSTTDPGTCEGAKTCSASGACVETDAQTCSQASECASGFCADGFCCDSACSGGCDACDIHPGKCTVVAAGASGSDPTCHPYVCDGKSASCPTRCTSDDACARPDTCSSTGQCELLAGASCIDADTLVTADARMVNCTPFACGGSRCFTTCSSIRDCASGFLCGPSSVCVAPTDPSLASGCSASPNESDASVVVILGVLGLTLARRPRRRTRGNRTMSSGQEEAAR